MLPSTTPSCRLHAFLALAIAGVAHAAAIDVQMGGLHAVDLRLFLPTESPAGVAVLTDARVAIYDGAAVLACDLRGCGSLHVPTMGLLGATMATAPTGDALWIGEHSGALWRVPLPTGTGPPIAVVTLGGLGGLAFAPGGELVASFLDGSGVLAAVDRTTGASTEIFRDTSAIEPPAFAFLPAGELVVEVVEVPVRRLYHYSSAQVDSALAGGTLLAPATGVPWSAAFPEISGVVAEGGGNVYVVDGLNREVWFGVGMTLTLAATGPAPSGPGSSSFLSAVALAPGWPNFVPGGGASSSGLALLSVRYDAGFQLVDASLTVVHTTGASGFLCGDADADDDVDVLDALLVAQSAAGLVTLTGLPFLQADVDGTGILGILDALRIAQLVAGAPVGAPC